MAKYFNANELNMLMGNRANATPQITGPTKVMTLDQFAKAAENFKNIKEPKSSKAKSTFSPGEYDYDKIYNDLLNSSSSYSSGGGGTFKPNVAPLISAYDQQNEAANALAKVKYDADREALLTNINRVQQQNALDTLRQTQAHAGNLANLESIGTEAARNERIQTAMRGLSGSGISQLNQLKNLISQGNKTTAVAKSNANSLEKLRQNLASASDETNTNLAKILDTYTNAISKANEAAAKGKASNIWDVESAYANNLARASASQRSAENDAREMANDIYTNLRNSTISLQNNLSAIKNMSTKELKKYVLANGLEEQVNTLATLDGKSPKDLNKSTYRGYVEQALGQQQYNTINELNNVYGINPYNYATGMNNISGLLYNYKNK